MRADAETLGYLFESIASRKLAAPKQGHPAALRLSKTFNPAACSILVRARPWQSSEFATAGCPRRRSAKSTFPGSGGQGRRSARDSRA